MNPLILNLARSKLFKGLTVGELETIFREILYRIEKYKAGEFVRFRGDSCDDLLILLDGKVKTEMQDFNGKVVRIEVMDAPSLLASGFLFATDNVFPVDVITITDCSFLTIPKKSVIDLCRKNEKFLLNLLQDMGDRLVFLSEKLYMLTLRTLKEKIADYILSLCKDKQCVVSVPLTKEELSQVFGVARPSLSRAFAELARDGILEMDGRKIIIKDFEKLKALIK
ncbi:MAG: family transcriptional regulator, dissimilatory nitrate respiration regulator [Kosmotoga sp.]|nr:family transcriptional regulator, dissimilatory nitrate respiration regulator [Kosmotoga sp.]